MTKTTRSSTSKSRRSKAKKQSPIDKFLCNVENIVDDVCVEIKEFMRD